MPLSSHGRPTGEVDVPRTRWRAATAVAARAPSEEGGGGMIIAVVVAAVTAAADVGAGRCRCRRQVAVV